MLGAVNCVDYPVCEMNGIGLFPTFVEHYRGEFINTTDDNKSVEIFQYLADRLLEKKAGSPLRQFGGKIDTYPSFLFQVKRGVNYSAIHFLKRAAILSAVPCPFYIEEGSDFPEIPKVLAWSKSDQTVEFHENFTVSNLVEFILDNSGIIDLDWSLNSARETNLIFAVFVSGDVTSYLTLKKYARKYRGRYAWATTRNYREMERYFGLKRDELPAVVLVNGTGGTFAILKNAIEPRDIKKFLMSDRNEFDPLRKPDDSTFWLLSIVGSLILILALIAVFYYFVFRKSPKHD
jgi:hypothetical protein